MHSVVFSQYMRVCDYKEDIFMAHIVLQKPDAGQSSLLAPQSRDKLVFAFEAGEVLCERQDNNLTFSFHDGSSVELIDFYISYPSLDTLDILVSEGVTSEASAYFAKLALATQFVQDLEMGGAFDMYGAESASLVMEEADDDDILMGDGMDPMIELSEEPNDLAALAAMAEGLEDSDNASDDFLFGGDGDDILLGLYGDDELYGGDGDDVLLGGDGDDILDGGFGVDTIIDGLGDDVIALDINDILIDGSNDADGTDIDILLGAKNDYNAQNITHMMSSGDIEMAVLGKEFTGQNVDEILTELGITKNTDGTVALGQGWGKGTVNGEFTTYTNDDKITIFVETVKIESGF